MPKHRKLDQHTEQGGSGHDHEKRRNRRPAGQHRKGIEDVGADHHEFAGREINDAGGLVNQNKTQSDQSVDTADGNPAGQQNQKEIHQRFSPR